MGKLLKFPERPKKEKTDFEKLTDKPFGQTQASSLKLFITQKHDTKEHKRGKSQNPK